MSTVRVYKVAELLNTTSQEVLALLKKAHGIELKSASSTLEEIVARQFVDRLAKQRNITLPKGDIFSEQAVKSKTAPGKKGMAPAPEPPKPAAPTLGPPRLIKKARPAEPAPEEAIAVAPPVDAPPPQEEAPPPVVEVAPEPVVEAPAPVVEPVAPVETPAPAIAAASPEPVEPVREKAAGRFVPPSIRLRVEEPGKAPPSAPPLQPKRQMVPQPPRVVPPSPRPPQAATGNLARPQGQRPFGQPRPLQSNTAAMLGGPRPLPSQPVRPAGGMPQRPGHAAASRFPSAATASSPVGHEAGAEARCAAASATAAAGRAAAADYPHDYLL